MTKEYPTPACREELLPHKAPPFFWTWPAHTLFFSVVFILCAGAVGTVLGLAMKAVYPFDPEFVPTWENAAHGGFQFGISNGWIPAVASAAISYLKGLELRRLWSDYRHEGWGAGECRSMYRRARATGIDLLPAWSNAGGNGYVGKQC